MVNGTQSPTFLQNTTWSVMTRELCQKQLRNHKQNEDIDEGDLCMTNPNLSRSCTVSIRLGEVRLGEVK